MVVTVVSCVMTKAENLNLGKKKVFLCNFNEMKNIEFSVFRLNVRVKLVFFSESAIRFLNLQTSKIKIFQKTIPSCNLNLLFTIIGGKFKFQVQDSFLEYFYFGDLEI